MAELQVGECVLPESGLRAVAQEGDTPFPHLRQCSKSQQQRRLLVAEPAQDLHRHARPRPWLRFAYMDDAAVAEAGLERRIGPSLDNGDLTPALPKKICSCRADNAGADDNCFHEPISSRYSIEPGEASRGRRKHSCGTRSAPCTGRE